MTETPLLRYGSLAIYDSKDFIYMMHTGCHRVLCRWPKKSAKVQRSSYMGLRKTKNNDKCIRCDQCRQGIPNKAFEFLERTAKIVAQ